MQLHTSAGTSVNVRHLPKLYTKLAELGVLANGTGIDFGSGKYRFKDWTRGQSITIERNDSYWNPDYKGYFKEIKFIFTSDAAARVMAVQSGDAQVAYDLPVNMAGNYAGNDQLNLIVHTFGQNTRLWYNMGPKAGATADIRVRQANRRLP